MTPSLYRTFLIAALVLGLLGSLFDVLVPSALPPEFVKLQESLEQAPSATTVVLMTLFGLVALALLIAATIGLYLFRPWAPLTALLATVIVIPLAVALGPTVVSGWSAAFTELSSTLWGAVLALTYFSPLKERFVSTSV
jgi:hypothetical protein